jgi:hypothetical protein
MTETQRSLFLAAVQANEKHVAAIVLRDEAASAAEETAKARMNACQAAYQSIGGDGEQYIAHGGKLYVLYSNNIGACPLIIMDQPEPAGIQVSDDPQVSGAKAYFEKPAAHRSTEPRRGPEFL